MKRTLVALSLLAVSSSALAVKDGKAWECQSVTQYAQNGSWDFPERGEKLLDSPERVKVMFTPYSATVFAKAFGFAQFSEVWGENDYTRVYITGEVQLSVSKADSADHRGFSMSTPNHVIIGKDCRFKEYEN